MWLEEVQEFVKVCIDGLMLMHRIFSVQNREGEREMVEANTEKNYENSNVAQRDGLLHCKKVKNFPVPSRTGCHLPNSPWPGIM